MARVEIAAGVCGFTTTVRATRKDRRMVDVSIESNCPAIERLASELGEVDAYKCIDLRGGMPAVLTTAYARCRHAACPVPSGIVKAIEVAAGLALPRDVTMSVSADD